MQTAGLRNNDQDVAGRIHLGRNLWDRAAGSRGVQSFDHQSTDGLLVEYDDHRFLGRERNECVSNICSEYAKANGISADLS